MYWMSFFTTGAHGQLITWILSTNSTYRGVIWSAMLFTMATHLRFSCFDMLMPRKSLTFCNRTKMFRARDSVIIICASQQAPGVHACVWSRASGRVRARDCARAGRSVSSWALGTVPPPQSHVYHLRSAVFWCL